MKKLRKRKVKRRSSKPASGKARAASLKKMVAVARIGRKSFVEKAVGPGARESASSPPGSLFLALVLIAGLAMGGAMSLFFPLEATDAASSPSAISIAALNQPITVVEDDLPFSEMHWHASLKIIAAGAEVPIPAGVGITIGNNVDNQASGGKAAPIHTHQADGVLHLELLSPRNHLEKMAIGYFFNRVWGKKFSRECVMEFCNGAGGVVKFFVNGKENKEFEDYSLKDGDELLITYELEN